MKRISRRRTLIAAESGRRGLRPSLAAMFLAGAAVVSLTTACDTDLRDHECQSDEYPVQAVGPEGGRQCVTNGKNPPAGTVRYPKGEVPQRVGDKWDVYWNDHGLDARGHLIKN